MWNYFKKGFGLGFGGRIGWELGGFVWRWVTRIGLVLALGISSWAAYFFGDPPSKPAQVQQHTQPKSHR